MTKRMPRRAALLAALAAAPALALAQAEGATDPQVLDGLRPGERGTVAENFQPVPRDAQGQPREYEPPAIPQPPSVVADVARLAILDKMTGQVETIEMQVGETRDVDRLELALRVCRVPEEDARSDAYAYLEIRDLREDRPRFSGWMFASTPALSALDHARYDVWVESCSTASGEASAGNE